MPGRLGLSASRRNNLSRKATNATGGEESPPYSTAIVRRVLRLGSAAASLQLPAACRQSFRVANVDIKNVSASCRDEQAGSLCSPIRGIRGETLNQEQRRIF